MMFLEHDFAISVVDAFAASAASVANDDVRREYISKSDNTVEQFKL